LGPQSFEEKRKSKTVTLTGGCAKEKKLKSKQRKIQIPNRGRNKVYGNDKKFKTGGSGGRKTIKNSKKRCWGKDNPNLSREGARKIPVGL